MSIKFYNTLTRKKEIFKPISKNKVKMYSCGPTAYDFAHIGNFRSYIFSDLVRRYLEHKGLGVKLVMNITDVDDKTIKGSRRESSHLNEFTKKYKSAFFEDLKTLNIKPADVYPEATKHIKEMVSMIEALLSKGLAYKTSDGIYFSISKFPNYGRLALLNMKGLKTRARVRDDEYEKEEARDFVLWKFWDKNDGDVLWKTSIGKGRPGWHIECSAMSMKYLGSRFDIHTGGVDLIFPHHQNEIAQSESLGRKFVNFWLHNEHLFVDGKKMSKSLGNFFTLRDLLKKNSPRAIRFLLLSAHYRTRLNLTQEALKQAEESINRFDDFISDLQSIRDGINKASPLIKKLKKDFEVALDDDLNMPVALSTLFDFIRKINVLIADKKIDKKGAKDVLLLLREVDAVLGLDLRPKKIGLPKEIKEMIKLRESLRKSGEWGKADRIREKLRKNGYVLEDSEDGVRVKVSK